MKVLVEAYGCTLNRGEAEEFMDGLLDMGHGLAETQDGADAFVLFTCGVIETTERHMLKRIGEFAAAPEKTLMVCGCLPNITPEKILNIAPHAILIGTSQHMAGLSEFKERHHGTAKLRTHSVGILPIASGCLGNCAYCITKNARGKLKSRQPEELYARLEHLVNAGSAEIQLCAQDTAVYGADKNLTLLDIVDKLSSVDGDFMMRIGMMNPASVLMDSNPIIRAFQNEKVFKFLHLPVQAGSDAILESMERHHTVADFERLVMAFRGRFPELSLSTDIIVGFPGETDDDFQKSMGLIERVKPDIVNITRFSSRPGTKAHSMRPRVPSRIAKDRSRLLTELRFSLSNANYNRYQGQTLKAIATESRIEGTTFLRTRDYKPVVVGEVVELGKWYLVRIDGNEKTHLTGTIKK